MRFPPAHAAPRDSAPPPKRRTPKSLRTAMSVAVAGVFGLVPAVMVALPAQAASSVADLTIPDAGVWEGGNLAFTLTYTGTLPGTFDIATAVTDVGAGHAQAAADATELSTDDGSKDYVLTPNRTAYTFPGTISGGANTVTVFVATNADIDDVPETLSLVVQEDSVAQQTKSATGTIWASADLDYPTFSLEVEGPATMAETAATTGTGASQVTTQAAVTVTARLNQGAQGHDVVIPVEAVTSGTRGPGLEARSDGVAFRDFTALPSDAKIVIPTSESSGSIKVQLYDDSVHEVPTQYFDVQSKGVALGAVPANGTIEKVEVGITDDDATPTVSISNAAAVTESITAKMAFPVTLSGLSETAVTVPFTTEDGDVSDDSNGAVSAASGDDFLAVDSNSNVADRTVVIPAYTKSKSAIVSLDKSTTTFEGPENFTVTIGSPTDSAVATLGAPATARGIITDGDSGPAVALTTAGDLGAVGTTGFREEPSGEPTRYISLAFTPDGPLDVAVKVDYAFKDVTAINGVDYRGAAGSVTLPPRTKGTVALLKIPVTIIGDTVKEGAVNTPGETFNVVLSSSTNTIKVLPASGLTWPITIVEGDDDEQPIWTTGDTSVVEGNAGTAIASVPITLSGPAASDITFSALLASGSADETGVNSGLTSGANDYDNPTVRTVKILAGSTTGRLDVPVNGDTVYERDEVFTVQFVQSGAGAKEPTAATGSDTARVTITKDDAAPVVTFNQVSATEGSTIRVSGTATGLSQYPYVLGLTFGPIGTNQATLGTDYELPISYSAATPTSPAPKYPVARGAQGVFTSTVTALNGVEVYLVPDDLNEATETFGVTATDITPAPTGILTTTGTYRILGTGTPNPSPSPTTEPSTDPSTDPSTEPTEPEPTVDPTNPIVSLAAPISFRRGVGDITLTGNSTVPGAEIQTWYWPLGTTEGWKKYKSPFQSDETTGDFTFIATLTHVGVKFAASITIDEEQWTSDTVVVNLRQNPIFSVRSSSKGTTTLTVYGDPRIQGLKVRFLEANRDGTWKTVGTGETSISGRFVHMIPGLKSGTSHLYKATVYGDGDVGLLTNTSRSARVTVR